MSNSKLLDRHKQHVQRCRDRQLDEPVDSEDNRYQNAKSKLLYRCNKNLGHDNYRQTPDHHTSKNDPTGCPACGKIKSSRKKAHETYVKECKEKETKERPCDLPVDDESNRYNGSHEPLLHDCGIPSHPWYLQAPTHHLQPQGCPICGRLRITKKHVDYVRDCINKNADLPINREDNIYKTSRIELLHKCKYDNHPAYSQTPNQHLKPQGCPICGDNRKSHKQYILDCKKRDIDLPLDREDNRYKNCYTGLLHGCINGHEYRRTPSHHLHDLTGCPECFIISITKTHKEYVTECMEKEIDLPIIAKDNIYKNRRTKLLHKCEISDHPPYLQRPDAHLDLAGCPKCALIGKSKSHEQYIKDCIKKEVDLPLVEKNNIYKNRRTELLHKCEDVDHPAYPQLPGDHLNFNGCPLCKNKTESKLYKFLKKLNEKIIHEFSPKWLRNPDTHTQLRFDFCDKKNKIIIELDGGQHFEDVKFWSSSAEKNSNMDVYKMNLAKKHKYSVIRLVQVEVLKNTSWKEELINTIEKCKTNKKLILGSSDCWNLAKRKRVYPL